MPLTMPPTNTTPGIDSDWTIEFATIEPGQHRSVHGLRLKDRSGIYRVAYFIRRQSEIFLIHAFQKKSQQTPKENIELAKQRLKGVL